MKFGVGHNFLGLSKDCINCDTGFFFFFFAKDTGEEILWGRRTRKSRVLTL